MIKQVFAVMHFIQHMDIDILNEILLENREYHCSSKPYFIDKLDKAFQKFREAGDTFLIRYSSIYGNELDNKKHKIFTFIGNHSKNYFDLKIVIIGGVVQDIFQFTNLKMPRLKRNEEVRIEMEMPF